MADLGDRVLAWRASALGDRGAFGILVEKHQGKVRRFFMAQTLGDGQLSDDLAQDTFMKAYANIGQFQGRSAFSTWLYRIAYNVYQDHLKKRRDTVALDNVANVAEYARKNTCGLHMDIAEAMGLLSEGERTCVLLQLVDGEAISDIANITGMAEGTVKSHLWRGKKKMAEYLKGNGYGG